MVFTSRCFYFMEAILFILLGMLALVLPVMFTFSLEILFGLLLMIIGIWQATRAWYSREQSNFWLVLLSTIANIGVGCLLLLQPLLGVVTLTLLLIAYFFLSGCIQIAFGWQVRKETSPTGPIFSGILALLMGAILVVGWPVSALWAIGLLFGVNLVFRGITLWMVAWHLPCEPPID